MPCYPTEVELKQLPIRAIVAFAARCARRVQPFTKAETKQCSAIEAAVHCAESFAAQSDPTNNRAIDDGALIIDMVRTAEAAWERAKTNKLNFLQNWNGVTTQPGDSLWYDSDLREMSKKIGHMANCVRALRAASETRMATACAIRGDRDGVATWRECPTH